MPDFLEGDVKLPVAGKIHKKWLIVPAGAALGYVAWRWYQASQTSTDAPAGSDGMYTTPDLTDMGLSTSGGSGTVTGNTGNTSTDGTNPNAIDNNQEWSDLAVEKLTNQGYNGQVVYAALGEFLERRSLDKDEATIVRAALAAAGQPPIGGPYSVIESATGGSGTGSTTLPAPTGLKVDSTTTTTATLSWSPVDGAGLYRVYRSGASTNVGATDAANHSITISGLSPNTEYSFQVAADTTTAKPGTKSAAVKGKTKAVSLAKPTGLKASAITKSSFRVTCSPVKGAGYYRWIIDGHAAQPTDQPYKDFTGLKANSSHRVEVYADTTTQSPGPKSSPITVKTKK